MNNFALEIGRFCGSFSPCIANTNDIFQSASIDKITDNQAVIRIYIKTTEINIDVRYFNNIDPDTLSIQQVCIASVKKDGVTTVYTDLFNNKSARGIDWLLGKITVDILKDR